MRIEPRWFTVPALFSLCLLSWTFVSAHAGPPAVAPGPTCASSDDTLPSGLVVVIENKPQGSLASDLRALKNPSISGVALQIHWSDIEPVQGSPNWAALDELFAAAESAGKWVHLLIFPGFFAPAWALEGVKTDSFPLQYGPGAGATAKLPMPWDRVYLTRWFAFLKQLGERYGKSPAFRLIGADGPTSVSAETTLPNSAQDLRKWQADAYTASKYIGAWQDVLQAYAADFPRQCVSISGGARAGLNLNDQGRIDPHENARAKQAIVDQATRLLGSRLALQLSDVHAGPGPHVENSAGEDKYIINYIGRVITGFQLRTSAEHGSEVMGAKGDPPLALKKSIDYALETNSAGHHVNYLEVYEPDVLADDLQAVLRDAAARFARKN
jgi:hypothetical protein